MPRSPISMVKPDTIATSFLTVATRGPGFTDVTDEVLGFLADAHAREGALHLHVRHTSASLTIQENADPDVLADLMTALDGFAPQDAPYRHHSEGPDDMPAHIRAMLTATSLTVPVIGGRLALGTWQAIYLIEHRTAPHRREIVMQFVGKAG
jgi:secondary thiamine-phosphate synthase enzyme